VKSGVSEKWSPRELISRYKLDAKLHCKTPFGAYGEVHTDPDITNTMEPRTKWGILLSPPPSAHLRLILREHKNIPATKEYYRVYIGTSSLIP
jgi:hypothetical protein